MRWTWLACPAVALSMFLTPVPAMADDVFAGAWTVSFTPDGNAEAGGAQAFKDAALFHNNELSSEALAMYGFNTVTYALQGDSQDVFTANMTSLTQGSLQWVGRKSGGKLTGILVWTKSDGSTHRYTFSGTAYPTD